MLGYPKLKKIPHDIVSKKHKRTDNYYWVKDKNNPEVIEHLKKENAFTDKFLSHTKDLQYTLYKEIKARIQEDDMSVPFKLRGYTYYTKFTKSKEHPIHCRKKEKSNKEEVLLDVNENASKFAYYTVRNLVVSQNDELLGYSEDSIGRTIYNIKFKDLTTNTTFDQTLTNTSGNFVIAKDNKTVFYTVLDKALRSNKIYMHKIGTDPSQDREIYEEKDPKFSCYVYQSKSRDYIFIKSLSKNSTEIRYTKSEGSNFDFQILKSREEEHEYLLDHINGKFFILSNKDYQNFQLYKAEEITPEKWVEVIDKQKDNLIENFELYNTFIAIEEREEGQTKIKYIYHNDNEVFYIDPPSDTSTTYIVSTPDPNTKNIRVSHSSLTHPPVIYDFDTSTQHTTILKEKVVPTYNKENYVSSRIFVESHDGLKIPVSIVHHKDTKPSNTTPFLLYGYGSYGATIDPTFSISRVSLLDRGFIFGIAHVRGGEDMGREWYLKGKLLNKKNTFLDFISIVKYLTKNNFTSPDKLVISGASAGGLLIGATINMEPELFRVAIADVPFVDVLTTMLDDSIPLTTGEYLEWGDPNKESFYSYILDYSPYDNVKKASYPSIFITTGLHDAAVQYWEPVKWASKLREFTTSNNPILLSIDMDFGHSGASGRFEQYKTISKEYAFILSELGIK